MLQAHGCVAAHRRCAALRPGWSRTKRGWQDRSRFSTSWPASGEACGAAAVGARKNRRRRVHAGVPGPAVDALHCRQAGARLLVESAQQFSWVARAWRPTSAFVNSSLLFYSLKLGVPLCLLPMRNFADTGRAATGIPASTEAPAAVQGARCPPALCERAASYAKPRGSPERHWCSLSLFAPGQCCHCRPLQLLQVQCYMQL